MGMETENAEGLIKKAKPQWIPVSERLPDKNSFALVFTCNGIVGEAKYDEDGLFYWAGADFWADALEVTHWMHLPEPPKEGV